MWPTHFLTMGERETCFPIKHIFEVEFWGKKELK